MSGTESDSSLRQGKPNVETFPQDSAEWQKNFPAKGTWVFQSLTKFRARLQNMYQ